MPRGRPPKTPENGASSKKSRSITYKCTACATVIDSSFKANLHPLLGTLVCRKCYKSYGDGNFSRWEGGVDENGDDNYCRWCCDGGDLFGCLGQGEERCHFCFCKDCIIRNVPDDIILSENVEDIRWICYACDSSRIKHIQAAAIEAMGELKSRDKKQNLEDSEKVSKDSQLESEATSQDTSTVSPVKDESRSRNESKPSEIERPAKRRKTLPSELVPPPEANREGIELIQPGPVKTMLRHSLGSTKLDRNNLVKTSTPLTSATPIRDDASSKPPAPLPSSTKNPSALRLATEQQDRTKSEAGSKSSPNLSRNSSILAATKTSTPKHQSQRATTIISIDSSPPREREPKASKTRDVTRLTAPQLFQRIDYYRDVKERNVSEIATKFGAICRMCEKLHRDQSKRRLIIDTIESLKQPLKEFDQMLNNFKDLVRAYEPVTNTK